MKPKLTFFPVGNGDMTLIQLENGQTILIDVNIRASADDPNYDIPDVGNQLRRRLHRDSKGRLLVDALLVSHLDQDHCTGLTSHFHLGPAEAWSKSADKIFIGELWASPRIFRRASRHHALCDEARAFQREAKRRVSSLQHVQGIPPSGDRILILGEDKDGSTDGLSSIAIKVGESFSIVNRQNSSMCVRLLGPLPPSREEDEEDLRSKNNSSPILNFTLWAGANQDACRFLTGGDAEVVVWEHLWRWHWRHSECLRYDILLAPHHCSWHSLSHDSWREDRENARVSVAARAALSQTRAPAVVVASSKAIKDDDSDPPCIRAKREYEAIIASGNGSFVCVGEPESKPGIVEFEITEQGLRRKPASVETFRRRVAATVPTVLVPSKSIEPTFPKIAPSRTPIKPWGGRLREPLRPIGNIDGEAQALLVQQVLALQVMHPALRLLHDGRSGLFQVEGHIGLRGEWNSRTIKDRFRVKLVVPSDYPQSPPVVFETEGKIPANYEHLMLAGNLCLGVPLEVDLRFASDRTLLRFVDDLVVPYLFGFSCFRKYGVMPFGEHCHGGEALLHSYQDYFGVGASEATVLLFLLAGGSPRTVQLARHEESLRKLLAVRRPDRFKMELHELRKCLAKSEYRTSRGEAIPRQFLSVRYARTANRRNQRRRVKSRRIRRHLRK